MRACVRPSVLDMRLHTVLCRAACVRAVRACCTRVCVRVVHVIVCVRACGCVRVRAGVCVRACVRACRTCRCWTDYCSVQDEGSVSPFPFMSFASNSADIHRVWSSSESHWNVIGCDAPTGLTVNPTGFCNDHLECVYRCVTGNLQFT